MGFIHTSICLQATKVRFWAVGTVAQPGLSFEWGTTRLCFAFFLSSPIFLFPHILPSPLYVPSRPVALPLPCRFPLPSLPSPKFS